MRINITIFVLFYGGIFIEGRLILHKHTESKLVDSTVYSTTDTIDNNCHNNISNGLNMKKADDLKYIDWNLSLITSGTYLSQALVINMLFIIITTISQKLQYELNIDTGSLILGKLSGFLTVTVGSFLAFRLSESIIKLILNTNNKWLNEVYAIILPCNSYLYSVEFTDKLFKRVAKYLYLNAICSVAISNTIKKLNTMTFINPVISNTSSEEQGEHVNKMVDNHKNIKPYKISFINVIKKYKRQIIVVSFYNIILFKLLNGQLNSFTPSEISHPGAFAMNNLSLEADGYNYASKSQKNTIQQIGRQYGCHTCGFRSEIERYIADHQPPSGVIKRRLKRKFIKFLVDNNIVPLGWVKPKQYFYPQCNACSTIQSKAVLFNRRRSITHYDKLRGYHLCPCGFLIVRIILDTKWSRLKRCR